LVTRRVRAKNVGAAFKEAVKKYPSMTVMKVNWLKNIKPNKKDEKSYAVVAHKRKVKRK